MGLKRVLVETEVGEGKGLCPVGSIKGLEKRIVFLEYKIAATSFPVVNNTHENEGENTKFFTID